MLCAGQVYHAVLTVKNQTGAPSTTALAITKPDGTLVTPAPTLGAGSQAGADWVVTYDYTLPSAGLFGFTWATQGPGTAPPTDWQQAREFRSVISLADAREYLGVLDTSRDNVILGQLAAVTKLIERYIGTCVIKQVTDEFIPGSARDMIRLPSGPVPSVTSVTSVTSVWAAGPSWATADLVVNPPRGHVYPADQTRFWNGPWRATYTAGRPYVSDDILEGAKLALWDLWATQRAVSADTTEPSMGEVSDYETATPGGWRLPPRVLQLIDGERPPAFA